MENIFMPFDIEAAKQGAKVVTRNGHPARVICYDRQGYLTSLIVLISFNGFEMPHCYMPNGRFVSEKYDHGLDLLVEKTF